MESIFPCQKKCKLTMRLSLEKNLRDIPLSYVNAIIQSLTLLKKCMILELINTNPL
jgi:hypothetical protein